MAPPRCTRNASDFVPSGRSCSADISPTSATWNRVHELGQPFTWIRMSSSRSGNRAASSSASHRARPFVSPMASLQNSIPVHAMIPRRNVSGRTTRSSSPRRSESSSTASGLDVEEDDLLLGRRGGLSGPERLGEIGHQPELVAADPSRVRRRHEHASVALLAHASVVPPGIGASAGAGPSGSGCLEELRLEHLADPLGTPVLHEELHPRVVPGAAVAVLAVERGDPHPRLGDAARLDEGAQPRAYIGLVDRPPPTMRSYPGPSVGVIDADQRDVVDLGVRALHGAAADRRLVLARQVRERRVTEVARRDGADVRRGVQHLVGRHAGERAPEEHAGCVAARLLRREPDRLDPFEDRRHVLDTDPVQLHVLPVGDVGDVASEALARPRDRAQLLAVRRPPSIRIRIMKNSSSSSSGSAEPVRSPGTPCLRCVYSPYQRSRERRSCLPIERNPPGAKIRSIRSRTFRPSSSFLICSAVLSGSW